MCFTHIYFFQGYRKKIFHFLFDKAWATPYPLIAELSDLNFFNIIQSYFFYEGRTYNMFSNRYFIPDLRNFVLFPIAMLL